MKKTIRLNYVEKCSPILDNPGLWKYAGSEAHRYKELDYWTGLAVKLDEAGFDGLFLGDALGVFDTYGDSGDAAVREGLSIPVHDPILLLPAMAAVTKRLGLAVTCSLTYEHPYALARKMSTLDHLCNGRLAWNIVTSNLHSAALGFGMSEQWEHDLRYDRGDEFMEVCYKLWELSWEDGAIRRDLEQGIYADPQRVHRIRHHGRFYQMTGIHLCEPSLQRTPVLFQAGSSQRGREFAARHAECNFLNAITVEETRHLIADIRQRAAKYGRQSDDILFFPRIIPVVGDSEEEAAAKMERYFTHLSTEGTLALLSSWTKMDMADCTVEGLYAFAKRHAAGNAYVADYLQRAHPNKIWSIDELVRLYAFGGIGNVIVGTSEQVADRMERFIDDTGADGFNIGYISRSETLDDFIAGVLPVLRARGRISSGVPVDKDVEDQDSHAWTYRHRLFGKGAHLPSRHPARHIKLEKEGEQGE